MKNCETKGGKKVEEKVKKGGGEKNEEKMLKGD